MEYIELILASISTKAATQSRMEDARVERWGVCLDSQN